MTSVQEPPRLPHITQNITPYLEVLLKITRHAYSQLLALIKTLPLASDPSRFYGNAYEADLARKKQLLQLIVKIRHYFVKIHVLHKWSANSPLFNTLIDLLNWLRLQQFQYDELFDNVKRIKIDMNFAKLPNHDLATSFVVLNEAHYANNLQHRVLLERNVSLLPSYNLLETRPLAPAFMLKLVKHIDTILRMKVAAAMLRKDGIDSSILAEWVFRNASVKDGKLRLVEPGEFEMVLTIIETSNDESQKLVFAKKSLDEYQFVAVDFVLLFAAENGLLSANEPCALPDRARAAVLGSMGTALQQSVLAAFCYAHSYCLRARIALIARACVELAGKGAGRLTWGAHIRHVYSPEKGSLFVYYWTQRAQKSGLWVQIGLDKDALTFQRISVEWWKDGLLVDSPDIPKEVSADQPFSIASLMELILEKHSNELVEQIATHLNNQLEAATASRSVFYDQGLGTARIPTSKGRSVVFGVDRLLGLFYFENPLASVLEACKKVELPNMHYNPTPANNHLPSEPHHVAGLLFRLRMELLRHETEKVLLVCGWQLCNVVSFPKGEAQKLSASAPPQCFLLPLWPGNWFLAACTYPSGVRDFWLVQTACVGGLWRILYSKKIETGPFSYEEAAKVGARAAGAFSVHVVMLELAHAGVRPHVAKKTQSKELVGRVLARHGFTVHPRSVLVVVENKGAFSSSIAKRSLVLTVVLEQTMRLDLYGESKVRGKAGKLGDGVEMGTGGWGFHLWSEQSVGSGNYFTQLFERLKAFSQTLRLLGEVYRGGVGPESVQMSLGKVTASSNWGQLEFQLDSASEGVELSVKGPHEHTSFHLRCELDKNVSNVGRVLQYVQINDPVVKSMEAFEKGHSNRVSDSKSISALEQALHEIAYHILWSLLFEFVVVFDMRKEVVRRQNQRLEPIKMVNRSLVEVRVRIVELRGQVKLQMKLEPILIENQLGTESKPALVKQKMALNGILRKLAQQAVQKWRGTQKAIFMRDMVVCEVDVLEGVLGGVYDGVIERFAL